VLKKLAVAVVVAAISVIGMTASAALALRITDPHDPTAKLYKPDPGAVAEPERKAHPWDEPCEIAETEATVLVEIDGAASVDQLIGRAISIEVRLLTTLRERGRPHNRVERKLLRALERSLAADRLEFDAFRRAPTEARVQRWFDAALRRNAQMAKLSRTAGAPACSDYFGN
jgi:hypothetical protein